MSEYLSGQAEADLQSSETNESGEFDVEASIAQTYADSRILEQKAVQAERGEPFRAGFTDIDNTFFRADRAEQSQDLARLAQERAYPLVAVTGNDYAGVISRINKGELPRFEMIIGSVGTEIWALQADGQTYTQDEYFRHELETGGYHRPEVAQVAHGFFTELTTAHPEFALEYQGEEKELRYLETGQGGEVQPFKLSFCFYAESAQQVLNFSELAAERFPNQELVVCEEIGYNSRLEPGDERKKYNLDILPITKAGAVEYAASLLGVEQGIVAGDSGNDIDMLLKTEKLNAVVVGGAKTELVGAANQTETTTSFQKVTDENGQTKAVYIERDQNRLGPDSIRHAAEVLLRAERIKEFSASEIGEDSNVVS